MPQQQTVVSKRKNKEYQPKLSFNPGQVFDPTESKAYDFELDRDSARYKASKGEGGDRSA